MESAAPCPHPAHGVKLCSSDGPASPGLRNVLGKSALWAVLARDSPHSPNPWEGAACPLPPSPRHRLGVSWGLDRWDQQPMELRWGQISRQRQFSRSIFLTVPESCVAHTYPSPCQSIKYAAATAAKSLQSCPTPCDPRDGSPPGSAVPGILQARTLYEIGPIFDYTIRNEYRLSRLKMTEVLPDASWLQSAFQTLSSIRAQPWGPCLPRAVPVSPAPPPRPASPRDMPAPAGTSNFLRARIWSPNQPAGWLWEGNTGQARGWIQGKKGAGRWCWGNRHVQAAGRPPARAPGRTLDTAWRCDRVILTFRITAVTWEEKGRTRFPSAFESGAIRPLLAANHTGSAAWGSGDTPSPALAPSQPRHMPAPTHDLWFPPFNRETFSLGPFFLLINVYWAEAAATSTLRCPRSTPGFTSLPSLPGPFFVSRVTFPVFPAEPWVPC